MRILHVADLHFNQAWFAWVSEQTEHYDAIVIAGDLLDMFDYAKTKLSDQINWVTRWMDSQRGPLLIVSGNHDFYSGGGLGNEQLSAALWLKTHSRSRAVWVDGATAEIHGVKFGLCSWGWQYDDWPLAADVVIVHAPPSFAAVSADGERDVGDPEVRDAILEHTPRWVLSGHVHEPRRWWTRIESTLCLNPGCDPTAPIPNFIVVDTHKNTATWHVYGENPDMITA